MWAAKNAFCLFLGGVLSLAALFVRPTLAQAPLFVAPPRTISDITAILDQQRPDPTKTAAAKAAADAQPRAGMSPTDLSRFYYDRGNARAALGRLKDAIGDAEKAVETARGAVDANFLGRLLQFQALQYSVSGDPKRGLETLQRLVRDANAPGAKGFLISGYRAIASILIQTGDIAQAETYLRRNIALVEEARTSGLPGWRSSYPALGQAWESELEFHRAMIFQARGQFREAENAYRSSEIRRRASVKGILSRPNPPPETQILQTADFLALSQARMKARQGRFAEAEADARRALLARLKDQGKYNPVTPRYIMGLASILVEQGRYGEAEKLVRVGVEIARAVGIEESSQIIAQMLSNLADTLNLQHKSQEAAAVYAEIETAIKDWPPQHRQAFDLNGSRIHSLYTSGQIDRGIRSEEHTSNSSH